MDKGRYAGGRGVKGLTNVSEAFRLSKSRVRETAFFSGLLELSREDGLPLYLKHYELVHEGKNPNPNHASLTRQAAQAVYRSDSLDGFLPSAGFVVGSGDETSNERLANISLWNLDNPQVLVIRLALYDSEKPAGLELLDVGEVGVFCTEELREIVSQEAGFWQDFLDSKRLPLDLCSYLWRSFAPQMPGD